MNSRTAPWLTELHEDHCIGTLALKDLNEAERIVFELLERSELSDEYYAELASLKAHFAVVKDKVRCSLFL